MVLTMKNFLNIKKSYKFEWQDLRAFATILNVIGIILFGYTAAWLGLAIAVVGIIKDFTNNNRHLNDFLLHGATLILNIYFLAQI